MVGISKYRRIEVIYKQMEYAWDWMRIKFDTVVSLNVSDVIVGLTREQGKLFKHCWICDKQ